MNFKEIKKLKDANWNGRWQVNINKLLKKEKKDLEKFDQLYFYFPRIEISKEDQAKNLIKNLNRIQNGNSITIKELFFNGTTDLSVQLNVIKTAAEKCSSAFKTLIDMTSTTNKKTDRLITEDIDAEVLKGISVKVNKQSISQFIDTLHGATLELKNLEDFLQPDTIKKSKSNESPKRKSESQITVTTKDHPLKEIAEAANNHPIVINSLTVDSKDTYLKNILSKNSITINHLTVDFDWELVKNGKDLTIIELFKNNKKLSKIIKITFKISNANIKENALQKIWHGIQEKRLSVSLGKGVDTFQAGLLGTIHGKTKFKIESLEITGGEINENFYKLYFWIPQEDVRHLSLLKTKNSQSLFEKYTLQKLESLNLQDAEIPSEEVEQNKRKSVFFSIINPNARYQDVPKPKEEETVNRRESYFNTIKKMQLKEMRISDLGLLRYLPKTLEKLTCEFNGTIASDTPDLVNIKELTVSSGNFFSIKSEIQSLFPNIEILRIYTQDIESKSAQELSDILSQFEHLKFVKIDFNPLSKKFANTLHEACPEVTFEISHIMEYEPVEKLEAERTQPISADLVLDHAGIKFSVIEGKLVIQSDKAPIQFNMGQETKLVFQLPKGFEREVLKKPSKEPQSNVSETNSSRKGELQESGETASKQSNLDKRSTSSETSSSRKVDFQLPEETASKQSDKDEYDTVASTSSPKKEAEYEVINPSSEKE